MKNIKIFPKDWMQIHPYKQSTPIDSYYTSLANRIYGMMVETELINSFEPEDTKQICIRMAAYFEDVISGLGIWPSSRNTRSCSANTCLSIHPTITTTTTR